MNKNIIVIIIDTLRSDTLNSKDTPFLFNYSRNNYYFDQCYSAAPWTLLSCASILSGYYPHNHGMTSHFNKWKVRTIPLRVSELGYHTIGIGNNSNFDYNIGYQKFFHEYYFYPDGNSKIQVKELNHEGPFIEANRFIDKYKKKEPYFMLLHTNIVHDYYLDINSKYYKDAGFERIPSEFLQNWDMPDSGFYLANHNDPDSVKFAKNRYRSGAKYVDHKIEDLLKRIDNENTHVVIVSDHGEGFEPELFRLHHGGRFHNDQIHVPLILSKNFGKLNSSRMCSTTDIVPTILEKITGNFLNDFDGRSLFHNSEERDIYSEDPGYFCIPNTFNRVSYKDNLPFKHFALIRDGYKNIYQKYLDFENVLKYDLKNDSNELKALDFDGDIEELRKYNTDQIEYDQMSAFHLKRIEASITNVNRLEQRLENLDNLVNSVTDNCASTRRDMHRLILLTKPVELAKRVRSKLVR